MLRSTERICIRERIRSGERVGPRAEQWVVVERAEEIDRPGRRRRPHVVDDGDLDLVRAEPQAVAVVQVARCAAADWRAVRVDERAVHAEVGELPDAGVERQLAVALGQMAIGVGKRPVVVRGTADGEFAASDAPRLVRYAFRAAQRRQRQAHPG